MLSHSYGISIPMGNSLLADILLRIIIIITQILRTFHRNSKLKSRMVIICICKQKAQPRSKNWGVHFPPLPYLYSPSPSHSFFFPGPSPWKQLWCPPNSFGAFWGEQICLKINEPWKTACMPMLRISRSNKITWIHQLWNFRCQLQVTRYAKIVRCWTPQPEFLGCQDTHDTHSSCATAANFHILRKVIFCNP